MNTKHILWLIGGAALALAIYYAYKNLVTAAHNNGGLAAATPPPAPVGVRADDRPAAILTMSRPSPTGGILAGRKVGGFV